MPCPHRRVSAAAALVVSAMLAVVVVVAFSAAPAFAHARLVATTPAAGQTVPTAVAEVRLTYSEPVEESFSDVQVFDPSGQRADAGAPQITGPDVVVPMGTMTLPGTYTVVFRVIGADGHPVESRYTFIFGPAEPTSPPAPTDTPAPSATTIPAPTADAASPDATDRPTPRAEPSDPAVALGSSTPTPPAIAVDPQDITLQDAGPGTEVGLLLARVADYLALVVVAAGLMGAAVIFAGEGTAAGRRAAMLRLTGLGGFAVLVAALLVFVLGMSSAAAEPLPEVFDAALAGRFAGTRFGRLVLAQAGLGALIAAASAVRGSRVALWVATVAAAIAAALPGVWGHAGTTDPVPLAVASDWLHVIGAACWVGGLALVVRESRRRQSAPPVEPVVRFSRIAGIAIWVVLASGVVTALLHVGELQQLAETSYGRLVVVKALLFAGIAALGWANRNRVIPRLRRAASDGDRESATVLLRRLGAVEMAVMLAALGVAGGLASSIPAEAEAAARVEFVTAQLTEQASVNLTVDPARPGSNVMHLYILGEDGRPRPVDDATLRLTGDTAEIDVDLLVAGPGHYTALAQQIPAAGSYLMQVEVDLDGQTRSATATVVVQ